MDELVIQKKKDGLVIHQKDELVIQVNFWWVAIFNEILTFGRNQFAKFVEFLQIR